MADVVPVAEVREPDALEAAETLPNRHRVGQCLQRVGPVGQPVDHGHRCVPRELVHLRLLERADHDRAEEAGEDEGRVAVALAARELQVGGRQVERHPAELGDPHLEADARPRRRLVEDQADRSPGQDPQLLAARPLELELVGEVERRLELLARPVADARVAAPLEQLGNPRHRSILVACCRDRVRPMSRFSAALNEQIAHEFAASQQYVAIAVHYDAQTLPQLAAHFYRQAVEERNHAMIMVQYLLDADEAVTIPGVAAPQTEFADLVAPVTLALDQEKRVTEQIAELVKLAREDGVLVGEQFLHWFLQEQREEVSSMSALLAVMERSRENVMLVEEYLARESGGENPLEQGAPPAAGGAL